MGLSYDHCLRSMLWWVEPQVKSAFTENIQCTWVSGEDLWSQIISISLSGVSFLILYIQLFCSLCTSVLSTTARNHPHGICLLHIGKVLKPNGLALSSGQLVFSPPSLSSSSLSHTYPSSRSLLTTHLPSHLGWLSPIILRHILLWAQGKFCFHGHVLLSLPLSIAEPLSFLSSLTQVMWTPVSRITLMQPAWSYITVLKFSFITFTNFHTFFLPILWISWPLLRLEIWPNSWIINGCFLNESIL